MAAEHQLSLGPLEREVLCAVWQLQRTHASITAKQVQQHLMPDRSLAYTTVSTILNRLTAKGLLSCQKHKAVNHYRSLTPPDKTLKSIINHWLHNMLDSFGQQALAAFADEFNNLPADQLEQFKQQLKQDEK